MHLNIFHILLSYCILLYFLCWWYFYHLSLEVELFEFQLLLTYSPFHWISIKIWREEIKLVINTEDMFTKFSELNREIYSN